jgi:hypothetical protein
VRSCEACSGQYQPSSGKQRFCSACMVVERVCEGCGTAFSVLRRVSAVRRFCTQPCAMRCLSGSIDRARGPRNNRYNGGLSTGAEGRGLIVCRDGSLMFFYRGVMAAELGRLLRSDEIVHHINGDPTDDRLENLEVMTRAAHARLHHGVAA